MASAVASVVAGVVFGLALAAPPGPMNAIIADESVTQGWTAGFTAGLGAMTADAIFCGLTLLGVVELVEQAPTLRGVMIGVGGVLMLVFAYDAASDLSNTFTGAATDPNRATGFWKAFVLALTNPYQILFWLTVGVGMLQPGQLDVLAYTPYIGDMLAGVVVVETGSPALLLGFFGGITIWISGFPATLVALGERVDEFGTVVAGVSALVLAGFGVIFLADAVTTLS